MSESYRQLGDLGDVAAEYWASAQKHSAARFFQPEKIKSKSTLSLRKVHETLQSIALVPPGKGSQETRQQKMVKLLRSCRGADEMRFVVRALLGNMRLGATLKTILVALEAAVKKCENISEIEPSPTTETTPFLEEIYNICPRIPDLAFALLRGGMSMAAKTCSLTVGCPIQPMLANPCSEFIDVREFVRDEQQDLPAVLEWKYDGVRCQAHWDGKITRLFSRHLLDNTEQYPDVVQFIGEAKHDTVQSFVMDAEIVGIACDGEDGIRLLPFQDLSTRRGSGRQNIDDNDVQVAIFAFDLMFLNGESLLKETLWKRQQLLRESFRESSGFRFASSVPLPRYDESIVQGALEDAIRGGAEGLMIKLTGEDPAVTSHPNVSTTTFAKSSRTFGYESGKRGKLWLKLKRDYVNGYADTIDVVPIGAWHGSGRKAVNAFLSPVLFAVYDDDEGTFQSVSRCMSFSDDMYQAMREFYFRGTPYPSGVGSCVVSEETLEQQANEDHHSDSDVDNEPVRTQEDSGITDDPDVSSDRVNCYPCKPPNVTTNEKPTFWFKPLEVLEVSFADLSLSRAHTAGAECIHDDDHRGIALRFPRFKRRRPDKSVYQATSASQLADLYRQQSKIHSK
jgi:DNA ligase-1